MDSSVGGRIDCFVDVAVNRSDFAVVVKVVRLEGSGAVYSLAESVFIRFCSVINRIDVGSCVRVAEAVVSSTCKVVASFVAADRLDVVCACVVTETTCYHNSSQLLVRERLSIT